MKLKTPIKKTWRRITCKHYYRIRGIYTKLTGNGICTKSFILECDDCKKRIITQAAQSSGTSDYGWFTEDDFKKRRFI